MCDLKRERTWEETEHDINRLIEENIRLKDIQDKYEQLCIDYNNMRVAFLTAVDELSMLRKQLRKY